MILAPSHYAAFKGASVPTVDAYRTPLGIVPVSERARSLGGRAPFVLESPCLVQRPAWWKQASNTAPAPGEDTPETWEHSVEVQLPFLQRTLKTFEILPILFGDADAGEVARALAGTIDDDTLIVASSDLSHYHPYGEAKDLDKRCIGAICNLDIDEMKFREACGKQPLLTLMHLARLKGWKARLLDYRNSGDTGSDRDRVVGYTAIAFYEPLSGQIAPAERTFLLNLARATLVRVATNGGLPEVAAAEVPRRLTETNACFVTLTHHGSLRGCIGHILPREALYQAVIHNAQNAACAVAATSASRLPSATPAQV